MSDERAWEFVTLAGDVVATYNGPVEKLTEVADATAEVLDVTLVVREIRTAISQSNPVQ